MTKEAILNEIKNQLKTKGISENISPKTKIADLAIDSLDFLEFTMKIEEKFNTRIDEKKLTSLETIGDFLNLFELK